VLTHGPTARPQRVGQVRGKDLIESSALDSFISNGGEEASSNCAGVLPFLRRLQQLLAMRNLLTELLDVFVRRASSESRTSVDASILKACDIYPDKANAVRLRRVDLPSPL